TFAPSLSHDRRHDCSSHRPPMFLSSRIVPPTPPSLVKFRSRALALITGASISVPSSDHVPELMNAVDPPAHTDATADPVSWHAGATTGVPACADETSARSLPTTVPGCTISVNTRVGSPISEIIRLAHVCDRASTNCVVVATVYSEQRRPLSQ